MNQDDFIMTFENALSDEWCDRCILEFEKAVSVGRTKTRFKDMGVIPIKYQDSYLEIDVYKDDENYQEIIREFNSKFFGTCYPLYQEKFGVLLDAPFHDLDGYKIQKTRPGEGYHIWHFETSGIKVTNRLLVYTVSLNDVSEGGETEFLYQHFRLKQKKGSLTIFPAGFTHTHRGNPPLSGTKYIMTGWISYVPIPE